MLKIKSKVGNWGNKNGREGGWPRFHTGLLNEDQCDYY